MLERLRDPKTRARMRKDILEGIDGWYNHLLAVGGDWNRILLVGLNDPKNRPFVGKSMADLIEARGGEFRLAMYAVPATAGRVLERWKERRRAGLVTASLSAGYRDGKPGYPS